MPRLAVWDDYGPVGSGASNAKSVLAENGGEYIIKGRSLNPALPWVAANELIAAQLAELLGLPLLDYRILELNGELYFGSAWMTQGSFHPALTEQVFQNCENKDRAYDLIAFDFWILNQDRHQHNLIARRVGRGNPPKHLMMLNDHSHSLIPPNGSPTDLANLIAQPAPIHLSFLSDFISDQKVFSYAIDLIEGIRSDMLHQVFENVPPEFLPQGDKPRVEQFLVQRQASLRSLVNLNRAMFPNLGGPV